MRSVSLERIETDVPDSLLLAGRAQYIGGPIGNINAAKQRPNTPEYDSSALPRCLDWLVQLGVDPLRLEQVFDEGYFMASHELNLLNTLMLETREGDGGLPSRTEARYRNGGRR